MKQLAILTLLTAGFSILPCFSQSQVGMRVSAVTIEDANGNVIGPLTWAGVDLVIGGQLVQVAVGPSGFSAGGMVWYTTTDCSGQAYQSGGSSTPVFFMSPSVTNDGHGSVDVWLPISTVTIPLSAATYYQNGRCHIQSPPRSLASTLPISKQVNLALIFTPPFKAVPTTF
jgi:hypothetical protein